MFEPVSDPVQASVGETGGGAVSEPAPPALDEWDAAMVAVAQQRDRDAFMRLFDHFAPRVKGYLIKQGAEPALAEDLAQDVMLTLWRRADRFDPRQARVGTWIFAIARNRRIDVFRRTNKPDLDPDDPALAPSEPAAADDLVEAGQWREKIGAAVSALPEEQADLVRLAFFEDLTHSEIAARSGLPLGTVKSRLRLALGRMRRRFEDDDSDA